MQRDARTYVLDIVDSCGAVASALEGVDFESLAGSKRFGVTAITPGEFLRSIGGS